jgi:hypothetical protein
MVDCQRERDVRAIRAPHEMRRTRLEIGDERAQVGDVHAEGTEVCRARWCVRREKTPTVDDHPELRCERIYLLAKRLEISKCAVNEHECLASTALEVVERRLIDVDRADVGSTPFRLTRRASLGRSERGQRKQDQRKQ